MKRRKIFVGLLVGLTIVTGCQNTKEKAVDETIETKEQLVMIDNQLYYNTKKESTLTPRCGTLDGQITSTMEEHKIPKENNQSNFGDGFGYQIGLQENQVELLIDNTWIVFEEWKK